MKTNDERRAATRRQGDKETGGQGDQSPCPFINPSKPFWRAEALTPAEVQLLELVFAAHAASVARDNVSSVTLVNAFAGSGSYTSALAAALCTLGGSHAPIGEAWDLLTYPVPHKRAFELLRLHKCVPGWGNSFVRGTSDPLWNEVAACIGVEFPGIRSVLASVTATLHEWGKMIYPNPGAYTAATAIIVGMSREIAPFLFVAGRLSAWTERLVSK